MNEDYTELQEEEFGFGVNFLNIKNEIKMKLSKLNIAIKEDNKKEIKKIFKEVDNLLEWYV